MKAFRYLFLMLFLTYTLSSCGVFSSNKRGCPAGGVGAEKYMDGSKVRKAKKFKS